MTVRAKLVGGLSDFEAGALTYGVELQATQLEPGEAEVAYTLLGIPDAEVAFTAFTTSRAIAIDWATPPDTLNFSIQVGSCGALFGGRERIPYSIMAYRSVGAADWSARVGSVASSGYPTFALSVPARLAELLSLPTLDRGPGWLQIPVPPHLGQAFVHWTETFTREGSVLPEQESTRDQLYWWLQQMLEPLLSEKTPVESLSDYVHIVRKGNDLADAHTDSPISIVALAEHLKVSVRTLQRAYQTVFGVRVSEYLRNRRLERAHTLLRKEQIPVYRAAYANGFNHLPRFSKLFRTMYGAYPSEIGVR